MAIKIPDAPNIIGGEPVLRSPETFKGTTATPWIKHDPSAAVEATNAVGTLLANVNQERINTYMTQASLWWTENMNKHMRETMDKYKGPAAMDLYVKTIKPFAEKLTDNLIGEPKDDGVVRIADPKLKAAFKRWADGQMRTYNAQIGNYEGQELARYNESTFDAREQQISEGLMQATTPEEVVGYSQSMLDLNRLRYRGYNPDRISQLAAAKVDAALLANVQAKINADVEKGYSYYSDPQVQAALSSSSKAKIQKQLREALVEQGKARGGEGLANDDGARLAHYTSQSLIQNIYNTEDPEIIRGVQLEIMGGAKDRADGLKEKAAGVQAQVNASYATSLANARDENEFYNTLSDLYETNPTWATSIDAANQQDAIDSAVVRYMAMAEPNYDKDVSALTDTITKELSNPVATTLKGRHGVPMSAEVLDKAGAYSGRTINTQDYEKGLLAQVNELELSGKSHDDAVKIVAQREARLIVANKEYDDDTVEAMARYDVLRDRYAEASDVYTDVMNDVVSGTYSGGYDERVAKLPLVMQRDLYAAVGTGGEYKKLVDSHSGVADVFKDVDSTYPNLDVGFRERAKRMAMNRISQWEKAHGDTASGQQLRQLVQLGYADAKDPISNAMEDAIRSPLTVDDLRDTSYWGREAITDKMAEEKLSGQVVTAGTKAFSQSKPRTSASDKEWDDNLKYARAKIKSFRNNLPESLRYVVDKNMDMYAYWYTLGDTNKILNHVKMHQKNAY